VTLKVVWPAALRCAGQDKLVIVDTQSEWEIDPDLQARPYAAEDRLIDSVGAVYRPLSIDPKHARLEPAGTTCTAAEFQGIAERHLKVIGAPAEWLTAYLQDFSESQQVRAALQYVARVSAEDGGAAETEGEPEPSPDESSGEGE
jgi:hypothetical protein